jgi:hypothetical protein
MRGSHNIRGIGRERALLNCWAQMSVHSIVHHHQRHSITGPSQDSPWRLLSLQLGLGRVPEPDPESRVPEAFLSTRTRKPGTPLSPEPEPDPENILERNPIPNPNPKFPVHPTFSGLIFTLTT